MYWETNLSLLSCSLTSDAGTRTLSDETTFVCCELFYVDIGVVFLSRIWNMVLNEWDPFANGWGTSASSSSCSSPLPILPFSSSFRIAQCQEVPRETGVKGTLQPIHINRSLSQVRVVTSKSETGGIPAPAITLVALDNLTRNGWWVPLLGNTNQP